MLEVDGKPLPETYAILRYLAKKYGMLHTLKISIFAHTSKITCVVGLLGKDEFEQALVDAYADMLKDFGQEIRPWVSVPAATPQDEKVSTEWWETRWSILSCVIPLGLKQ